MSSSPLFIDRPMSLMLDAVRGLAALAVLVGHAVQMQLYTGAFPFDMRLQHNAVIVFFVLSGLVIANSAARPGTDLRSYAIARFARIMPVALFAVVLSAALVTYGQAIGLQESSLGPQDRVTMLSTIVPLLFLGESVPGAGLVWNPPYWSLTYEVWYYALFGLAMFTRGRSWMIALAAASLLAGIKVLLLLPVWLLGVAIARYQERLCLGTMAGLAALVAGAGVLGLANMWHGGAASVLLEATGLAPEQLRFSVNALSDYGKGIGVALIFVGLRPLAEWAAALLEAGARPIGWLAGCSFTLYLIHWPVLMFVRGHGIGMGDSLTGFVGLLALVVMMAAMLAAGVERQTPRLRCWLMARDYRQAKAA